MVTRCPWSDWPSCCAITQGSTPRGISLPSLAVPEETRPSRPGLPNPLTALRASVSFIDDLPGLSEQLTNSIGELSGLIAEQVRATREQIAESKALRAETVALRQEVSQMRESFEQFRDKVPGL